MNPIIKRIVSVLLAFVFAVGILPVDKPLEANAAEETISDIYSGWYWPLTQSYTSLSSGFGYRASMGDYHQGIDIQRCEGQPIYAARKGTVVAVTYQASMGNYVSIRHGTYNGATIYTTYMHMKYTGCVSVGQDVDQTTVIGYVGATGEVTGPHLHFQICKNGINPAHNNNSDLNANYFNPSNITYSYDHTTPSPQTAPTNAWIKTDKSVAKVGETITFTYDADGATRYRIGAVRNGNLTVIEPGTSKSCSASFSEPGYYAVHAQCFNDYGYVDSPEIYIYVYNSVPTNAWIKTDKSVAKVGETITFTYDADGATRYRVGAVRNGNLTVIEPGTSKSCSASFSEPGYYAVHAQCFNDYGYVDSSETYFYVYNSTPTNAWIKTDKSVAKVGETITFTYDADGATRYRVGAVRNGNLTVIEPGTSKSCSTSFSEPGYYAVHAQCFNDYGYVDSSETYFYVYNSMPTNAWAEASATTVQVGEPVTFTYGAQGAYSQAFNYYINGNLTTIFIGFGTQQYTYTFDNPGTYITHITNYNDYGLTDSQDIVINVYDPNTIYTVTFDPNGGSNTPASQTKTYGQTMTLSAGIPTRMGYTFTVWNTKADGTGTSYAPGAAYTADENITLYAQWKKVEVMLQSIAVKTDPTKTTYTVGDTLNTAGLTLTATYSDNSTKTITSGFTCSPTKLDTAGFRTITVTYGGKTTTFGVTVNNPAPTQGRVKSVSVNDVSINYKFSTTLKPTVTADEGVKYSVKYESSNPNAVSVDNNGNVKGLKKGTATITCTVIDQYGNTVKDTCTVTVNYTAWQWVIIILLFGWIWY